LAALALASALLGGVSAALAGAGDFNVTIGGISSGPQGGGAVPTIGKPQTGLGNNFAPVPDTSARTTPAALGNGNALGNSSGNGPGSNQGNAGNGPVVPDQKGVTDPTTFSYGNNGTFSAPTLPGQPAGQFCSSNNVTVGENTQSRLHCSNTVNTPINGTIRN